MKEKYLDLLYRSFDGKLTPKEQKILAQALAGSPELQQEKKRIAATRELIARNASHAFKPFFEERVIQRLTKTNKKVNQQEQFFDSLVFIFRPVAITTIVILISLMVYNMKKTDRVSIDGALANPQMTLEEAIDPTFTIAMELSK